MLSTLSSYSSWTMSGDRFFVFCSTTDMEPTMIDSLPPDSLPPPLVVRNKRGRKVDETLPKSHQREVQRQFRARRAGHLLDLERRVSLLERENLILRHWAGVLPANRYLLGRGPTGCDTTKPLIADESDPEIQLITDESSPRDRSWPPPSAVPPARPPYLQEQSDSTGPMDPPQTAQQTATQQSMGINSPIAPTAAPAFEKQGFETSPYPDARKFKLHPLYDQRPIFGDYPAPATNFDQVPALAIDRLLVKRESVYGPPAPAQMSSLLTQSQRADVPPPHDASVYYPGQPRPSYSRPVETYSSQTDMNGSNATVGNNYPPMYLPHLVSWSDPYTNPTSTSQAMNRHQPPGGSLTPPTPVVPPVGLASTSTSTTSPSSQGTSASGSAPDQRSSANSTEPVYGTRRVATYVTTFPTCSGTSASLSSSTYMQSSTQGPSAMYAHHTDGAQRQQSQQQQLHHHQQQQRQYHDGSSDSFRQ